MDRVDRVNKANGINRVQNFYRLMILFYRLQSPKPPITIDHPFLYCIVRMVENPNTKVGGVVPLFVGHTREPNVN